ncbi:sensor histidine kinase [Thermomonospora umbrina]|uniref:histidine kinase n=1 Tax=Thermomonospora umbrina TaxID=111806 RepID=A0A3D9T3M9_9ACTN|nr:HAMP domain-containing sensor histidine kinase [Thermomonospora umbrina]REE98411.1 signal transduction histidine kinase [Thermomonospora umbrina]
MSLRVRLFLSHLAAVLISVVAMFAVAPLLVPAGFDPEGDRRTGLVSSREIEDAFNEALTIALSLGLAVAVVAAVVFSRLLLRSLDRIRAATHRMAAGHYGEQVPLPGEPELRKLVADVNRLSAELADVERRRARLVSEVAHEMRTPLTTLRGQLDGVVDGVFAPSDELFASLIDDIARLQRLAGDLSSLSRTEEGAFRLERAETDVAAMALRAAERLRPQFVDQGVELRVEVPGPVRAEVDEGRLAQVVTNLLGNALAATDPGGRVEMSVVREGDEAVITVVDTGVGIAEEDLERIFHRFERVEHAGRAAPAAGSGIGLTIARGIVHAHGGEITARSPGPGEGATFRVRLRAP